MQSGSRSTCLQADLVMCTVKRVIIPLFTQQMFTEHLLSANPLPQPLAYHLLCAEHHVHHCMHTTPRIIMTIVRAWICNPLKAMSLLHDRAQGCRRPSPSALSDPSSLEFLQSQGAPIPSVSYFLCPCPVFPPPAVPPDPEEEALLVSFRSPKTSSLVFHPLLCRQSQASLEQSVCNTATMRF